MNQKELTLFTVWAWLQAAERSRILAGYARRYRERHPARAADSKRNSRKRHPEVGAEYHKAWKAANPERVKAASRRYYLAHAEAIKTKAKLWVAENPEKLRVTKKKWKREQSISNPNWRIKNALSARVREALRGKTKKTARAVELLGCSLPNLRRHLQEQFTEGMRWDNYGTWHVDHIRPCASFDLTDTEQQKRCFSYTNLQPLWGVDNMRKGSRYHAS